MKKLTLLFTLCLFSTVSWAECWEGDCLHGRGSYTYEDGRKYVGQWSYATRSGQGTMTWPDGQKYVGNWIDDVMTGQGTMTWPSGQKYVGQFKDGKIKNGQGTMTWPDGQKYVGQYKDLKYNGQGTYTWPSGQKYVGQFKDGKYNGQGTMIYTAGQKYVGNWINNVRTGEGTQTWPSGQKYVGQFKDDKYNGQGTMTFENDGEYVGNWSDDVRTGQGTMLWPSGQKYVGQWRRGKQNFQGTMAYADGRKYVGNWKDDVMTGQGTMTYPDGRKYVGQWKDGAPERDFAKEERSRKAAEAERLGKAVEAERLRKAAEAERDSESKSLLIILLAGIAAVFLVIKILRPSKDTEGAGVAPHIEPKQLATAPLGNARIKKSLEENPLRQDLNLKPLQPSARPPGTRFIGGTGGYTIKIVLSLIFFVFLWVPFLSPIFTDAIEESSYVVYGGESEALLAAILSSAIWIAGMAPLLWFWNKKRTASHVAASSTASQDQPSQGSKSSDELQPLKIIQAAQIADEVSSAADIESVIQVASILSSEQEVMQAVQEANEDLRDAYETKVKDLFEKQGIDRESLTAKAIESEVNRCMKLGLNKICLDERLVPLLGSQD